MALPPEYQAQLDAARAAAGLPPRRALLPEGTIASPRPGPNYARAAGPLVGRELGSGSSVRDDIRQVGRNLDPAGITRGSDFGVKEFGRNMLDPAGVFGGSPKKVKGSIDPTTGTVTVNNYGKQNEQLSNAYTNYLRTGDKRQLINGGGAFKPLKRQVQDLRQSGWQYGQNATATPQQRPVGNGASNPIQAIVQGIVSGQLDPWRTSQPAAATALPVVPVIPAVSTQPQGSVNSGWRNAPTRNYANGGPVKKKKGC